MRSLPTIALGIVVGCIVAPAAAAASEPVHADLVLRGALAFEGAVHAEAAGATIVVRPPLPGRGVLALEDAEGMLRIVRSSRPSLDTPLGPVWLPPEHETEWVHLRAARLEVREPREDALVVLAAVSGGRLGVSLDTGARQADPRIEGQEYVFGGYSYDALPYYFHHQVPAHSFRLPAGPLEAPRVTSHGMLQVALTGVVLDVAQDGGVRSVRLGSWDEEGGHGSTATDRHHSAFAVLALEAPRVLLPPGALLDFYSPAPTLALDGRLVLAEAAGPVSVRGASAMARGDRVEVEGSLVLEPRHVAREGDALGPAEGETRVRVEGQARSVLVGGRPLLHLPEVPAETAAPLVALLAAAAAWLTGAGPKALGFALMPLYAGATPAALLDNERRRAIYQAVLRNPGVHMRELQRVTNLRWGSLQYHAAVLLGMGLLTAARSGRRTVLACDVHGLATEQIRALHLLRGARASRVAQALATGKPVTQREITLAASVSPRLVSRYLTVMTELGLVEVAAGRPKRYHSTARMAELLPRAVNGDAAAQLPPA